MNDALVAPRARRRVRRPKRPSAWEVWLFAYRLVLLAALVRSVIQVHRYPYFAIIPPAVVWVWWLIGRRKWEGKPSPTDWFILATTSINVAVFWAFN